MMKDLLMRHIVFATIALTPAMVFAQQPPSLRQQAAAVAGEINMSVASLSQTVVQLADENSRLTATLKTEQDKSKDLQAKLDAATKPAEPGKP
jgi:predicted  nucleic acid-binding Zn-ribbon protein